MKASSASAKRARASGAASTARSTEPFTGLRFAVAIERMKSTRAVEVLLPAARIIGSPTNDREVQFEPLVVRRGLTESTDWYDWWDAARRQRRAQQRRVTIVLMRTDGSEGVRWIFPDSRPVAYSLSPLNAVECSAVIESLELSVGDFELFRRQ